MGHNSRFVIKKWGRKLWGCLQNSAKASALAVAMGERKRQTSSNGQVLCSGRCSSTMWILCIANPEKVALWAFGPGSNSPSFLFYVVSPRVEPTSWLLDVKNPTAIVKSPTCSRTMHHSGQQKRKNIFRAIASANKMESFYTKFWANCTKKALESCWESTCWPGWDGTLASVCFGFVPKFACQNLSLSLSAFHLMVWDFPQECSSWFGVVSKWFKPLRELCTPTVPFATKFLLTKKKSGRINFGLLKLNWSLGELISAC